MGGRGVERDIWEKEEEMEGRRAEGRTRSDLIIWNGIFTAR